MTIFKTINASAFAFNLLMLTLLLKLNIGCTSLTTQSRVVEFEKAIQVNIEKGSQQSSDLFENLCKFDRHKASCLIVGKEVAWRPSLAIMQGPTGQSFAEFVLVHKDLGSFKVYALDEKSGAIQKPSYFQQSDRGDSDWSVVNFHFTGLEETNIYKLIIVTNRGELVDYRQFKALAVQGQQVQLGVVSCMRDDLKGQDKIWDQLVAEKPQALFFIGDNAYLDHGLKEKVLGLKPDTIWREHVETRNRLKIFRTKKLIPIFSTWDDHDYGLNGGGVEFKHRNDSQKIYQTFFAMNERKGLVEKGPGLARSVLLAEQQFLFLDNRSFRTTKKESKVQTHFGKIQNQWIYKKVKTFKGVTWLISGDQFFGGYHPFESFQSNHSNEFKTFLRKLKETKRKVIFVSGDRHMSEIMKIPNSYLGYTTYELTSSPIHSSVYPGASKRDKNPLAIEALDGTWNYMMIQSKALKHGVQLDVSVKGVGEKVYFRRELGI